MKSNYKTVRCLDYNLFADDLDTLELKKKTIVNTINQYSYCLARRNGEFQKSLCASDILLPDGVGITAAVRMFQNTKIKKIAGADLHYFLLEKLNREKGSCFYLGSTIQTLERIRKRMADEYPNIKVETYSPPFKSSLSKEDNTLIIKKINLFKPDVLFIGMTAPKQELWSFQQKDLLETKMICSIGAVFDFYSGNIDRPGKIWVNIGLEWFGRLTKEPRRMWKRYLYYGVIFGHSLLLEKFKVLKERNSKDYKGE